MPTPLDILPDPISLSLSGMYALLMFWEALFPGRQSMNMKPDSIMEHRPVL